MSATRRILFAVSAGGFSRFITAGLGLVLMPVLFRHLGQEDLGLWFLLAQSGTFLGLMDFGAGPTLTRRIALVKGRSGGDPSVALNHETRTEIADLIATGRVVYRVLAALVFALSWSLGLFFLRSLPLHQATSRAVWVAWTIICISYSVNTWAGVWSCLLSGIGYVGWDALIGTAVTALTLIGQIVAVLCGGGLIALAAVSTAGGLLSRYGTLLFVRRRNPELFEITGSPRRRHIRELAALSVRVWLTSLGAFLVLKTDQYFIAYFRGAADIPAYQAAYQLVANVYVLAISFAGSSSVFVSQLWQAGEIGYVQEIVRRNVRIGLGIMVSGVAVLGSCGKEIVQLWLGPGHFVGYPVLLVFCVMLTLEAQHVILAASSRATEDEPFAACALAAGLLNLVFTWVLVQRIGLLGVALGTCLAQLFTSNWFAVMKGLRRLRLDFAGYAREVSHVAYLAVPVTVLSWGIARAVAPVGPIGSVAASSLVAGVGFTVFLWVAVLEKPQRARVLLVLRRTR